MKRLFTLILVGVLSSFVRADVPATAFYVIATAQLKSLVGSGSLDKVSEGRLSDAAIVKGHFIRGAAFDVTTAELDIRASIDGGIDDNTQLTYQISVYSRVERKPLVQLSGVAKGTRPHYATDKWE